MNYDKSTGIFTWKDSRKGRVLVGSEVGSIDRKGYAVVFTGGKKYTLHRLAWLYVYGECPKGQIDHINGIRDDNRISNLRVVTNRENACNRLCHRQGKLVGCRYHKTMKKWEARIRKGVAYISIGFYTSEQEAHESYLEERRKMLIE